MLKVHANVLQVVLVKNLIKKLKNARKGYKKMRRPGVS